MAIIGDRNRFAVEYVLDADRGGVWLFGRVCFWVGGKRVGDFRETVSLRDFLFSVEADRRRSRAEADPTLPSLPAQEALRLLHSQETIRTLHRLGAAVDAFVNWQIYVVPFREVGRFLYRSPDGTVGDLVLPLREYERILEESFHHIGALYMDELIKLLGHGARRRPHQATRLKAQNS